VSARAADGSHEERLLWSLLRRFERDTYGRYEAHLPALATPAKQQLIARMDTLVGSDDPLDGSDLAEPVAAVLASARSDDAASTLLVQGLVLERLGEEIYRAAERSTGIGDASRALATEARKACEVVAAAALHRIPGQVGTGNGAYVAFADATHDILFALDGLSEPVDRIFGARYDIRFADLMGEFTADLLAACGALEMPRRKVIAHLAGASMGF
jgi:hypothetical protein